MGNKDITVLFVIVLITLVLYIRDNSVFPGGARVGKMRVNGTSNTIVKNDLKSVMNGSDYYVINLSEDSSSYLIKVDYLQPNYKNNKKYVMYDSEFDNEVNCPFGKEFQRALLAAKSNEDNKRYFDFYNMPPYLPYMTKSEMDKYKKITGHLPSDVITKKEADLIMDIHRTCAMFCIVNPRTNHFISFSGVGQKEANNLQALLDYLKTYDW